MVNNQTNWRSQSAWKIPFYDFRNFYTNFDASGDTAYENHQNQFYVHRFNFPNIISRKSTFYSSIYAYFRTLTALECI